ncbi:hypothetical protein DFH06DRAFT_1211117 [Mycena polygramma]|nr:hypothetical protein DFH06DRAFT_1211117 [Mycena polygramma]
MEQAQSRTETYYDLTFVDKWHCRLQLVRMTSSMDTIGRGQLPVTAGEDLLPTRLRADIQPSGPDVPKRLYTHRVNGNADDVGGWRYEPTRSALAKPDFFTEEGVKRGNVSCAWQIQERTFRWDLIAEDLTTEDVEESSMTDNAEVPGERSTTAVVGVPTESTTTVDVPTESSTADSVAVPAQSTTDIVQVPAERSTTDGVQVSAESPTTQLVEAPPESTTNEGVKVADENTTTKVVEVPSESLATEVVGAAADGVKVAAESRTTEVVAVPTESPTDIVKGPAKKLKKAKPTAGTELWATVR